MSRFALLPALGLSAAAAPDAADSALPLDRRLGIYAADDDVTDPRGGLFVRVHRVADGPD